ncbi:MAG: AMP-binding protein [Bacteroidales bacterium]|nr:AMP-binding protein [Bacteroidales bacterium]
MEFQSVNKLFEASIKKNWERPALSNYQGMTLYYKDVATRIEYLHLTFRECGLVKGDRVALCSRNQANWGVCFLAVLTYGAVPVPILHEFKPGNIHYLVNHSEAKVFFVDDVIWENLSAEDMPDVQAIVQMNNFKLLHSNSLKLSAIREGIFEYFSAKYPEGLSPESICYHEDQPEELALINYTSGTSGFSKGVMIPYRALYTNIYVAHHDAEPQLNHTAEVVSMLPSAHMYGMMFEFIFEMTIGAHVHFLTRVPSPKIIMKAFAEIHPDIIIAVPLIIEKVYKSQLKPVIDRTQAIMKVPIVSSLLKRKIRNSLVEAFGGRFEETILGGAAFNPEVEKFLKDIHFPFTVGYGMTECAPLITYAHYNEARLGSSGKAIRGCEIRIDSADPANVPGEVQVKGSNVFLGYFKNEEATKESFTEDGWFKTGDMGVIDADGYLYLRGRSKCMILGPSGQNIYPEELEAVVNNFTYVVDSLVIEDNNNLVALIYPDFHQAELDGLSPEQLQERLLAALPEMNRQIPNYAQLKRIEFMPEDFERTPKKSIKRYLYQRN